MLISYEWLKQYVDFDLPYDKVSSLLTHAGLKVENIHQGDNDYIFEIEITSNRPDWLSHIGVAREIAALAGKKIKMPSVELSGTYGSVHDNIKVSNLENRLCGFYTARFVSGVKIGPSPDWLQRWIHAMGLRPVNNVVDITNFVLFECGQPLHAFDMARLNGREIIVRRAAKGEHIILIDGKDIALEGDMVIADGKAPVAIAGVMGGLASEVGENTRDLLIESAYFDPVSIRRTSRRIAVSSESSYRFERGVDPAIVDWASKRACHLIERLAGGRAAEGVIYAGGPSSSAEVMVGLRFARIKKILGIDIDRDTVIKILEGLELKPVESFNDSVTIRIPAFRRDISREIDIIEELARIYGYDKIPSETTLRIKPPFVPLSETLTSKVKGVMNGMGYYEVISTSFANPEISQAFSFWSQEEPLSLKNPLRSPESSMRKTLVPGHLQILKRNQDMGIETVNIFEISNIYLPRRQGELPDEKMILAIVSNMGYFEVKGAIEYAAGRFLGCNISFTRDESGFLNPQTSSLILAGERRIGYIGGLSDKWSEFFKLRGVPVICELDFDLFVELSDKSKRFKGIEKFPAVIRDIAIVVDEHIEWHTIQDCVRKAGGALLEDIRFMDIYKGKQIPASKKGIAMSLTFRDRDRTLTSEEVNVLMSDILKALESETGAVLRTS